MQPSRGEPGNVDDLPGPISTPDTSSPRATGEVMHQDGARSVVRWWRRGRHALAATGWCATGCSVGFVLGGPVVAVVRLMAFAIVGVTLAVILSAMLGGRDPRTPFVRLMLIICVITGRRPGDYLPGERMSGIEEHPR
jgi:hypothetical protein